MASQAFLTVADAAKRVGVSRQTIFAKIKAGQLSAGQNKAGIKVVDVSELLRVFDRLLSDDEVKQNQLHRSGQANQQLPNMALQLELERAKLQIERRDFELEKMREQVQDLKERERLHIDDRAKLLGVIERQTLLLAAPRPARAPRATAAPKAAPAPAKAPTPAKPKAAPKKAVAKAPARPATRSKAPVVAEKPAAAKKATRK